MYVTNISALKTISTIPLNEEIILGGYYNVGDNGGGTFLWKTGSPLPAEDGGIIIYHDTDSSGWFERNITEPYLNVRWFGAVGDGVTDDYAAIQNTINAVASGYLSTYLNFNIQVISFGTGVYNISQPLIIENNVNITCENATIFVLNETVLFEQTGMIVIGNVSESITVSIENLTLDGNGSFSFNAFENPYYPTASGSYQYALGFTNNHFGIYLLNTGANVTISNCCIHGCNVGVFNLNRGSTVISNNRIYNTGKSGISQYSAENCIVSNNNISKVQGGFDSASGYNSGSTVGTTHCPFADGIYNGGTKKININNNTIYDIIRIGIVIEYNVAAICEEVSIVNNNVQNVHSCRGGEYNAAIWAEGGACDDTCSIEENFVSNLNRSSEPEGNNNPAFGILANNGVLVKNNICQYWDSGISGGFYIADSNSVSYCYTGITSSALAGKTTIISSNIIRKNNFSGISLESTKGYVIVSQNLIEDNGFNAVEQRDKVGLKIIGIEFPELHLSVKNNTFISTYNGDTSYAQEVSIYLISAPAPDSGYNTTFITDNKFIFDNKYLYPDDNCQIPCSLVYDNTSIAYYKEMLCSNNNVNSKFLNSNRLAYNAEDYLNGQQRFVGQDSLPPSSGDHLAGDYMLNASIPNNGCIGWICTAYGNPGTWAPFGIIGGVTASAVPDIALPAPSVYDHEQIDSIIGELRDLKQKLIDANLLTP